MFVPDRLKVRLTYDVTGPEVASSGVSWLLNVSQFNCVRTIDTDLHDWSRIISYNPTVYTGTIAKCLEVTWQQMAKRGVQKTAEDNGKLLRKCVHCGHSG